MAYEYKTVGAPEKGKRKKGARSKSDKVAAAFEEILGAEAVDGWEYMRTDLVPVIERSGIFSRPQETHRAVMVFRRALERPDAPLHRPLFDVESQRAPSLVPPSAPSAPSATFAPAMREPALQPAPRQEPLAPVSPEPKPGRDPDAEPDLILAQQLRGPSGPSGRR